MPKKYRTATLQVAIDLNAVPPAGIEGVEAMDAGTKRDGVICYASARRRRNEDESPQGRGREAV